MKMTRIIKSQLCGGKFNVNNVLALPVLVKPFGCLPSWTWTAFNMCDSFGVTRSRASYQISWKKVRTLSKKEVPREHNKYTEAAPHHPATCTQALWLAQERGVPWEASLVFIARVTSFFKSMLLNPLSLNHSIRKRQLSLIP